MKFHLVTYSDGEFKKQQDFINRIHGESFEIHAYDRDWLEGTNFYKRTMLCWMIRGVLDGGFGNHM